MAGTEAVECQALRVWTKLGEGGRLVIPAEIRESLGLRPGDHVLLRLENGELRLRTLPESVRRLQSLVHEYVPDSDRLLSEELIAERRDEAARE